MAQRRLAAIMFSDIVGYDSLLKEDEKKAFDIRKKNHRIHKRLIKKFKGRWLKEMESGMLASFSSIIDAVTCALSIQKATTELNIPVRIGLHQGEVIFEEKDVLGDGVNIASRIQNFSDKHGIVVSDTVYKDIRNKEGLVFESLGTHTLKGVLSPIGIYSVSCHSESILDFTIDTGELVRPLSFRRTTIVVGIMVIALLAYALYYFLPKFTKSSSEPLMSVLVIPFDNYLGTDTLDYFVEGMHYELIGDISKVSALNVKSKTTAYAIKNTNKSIPEIAKEFGIDNFVEGAVLCLGDSICVQVKLVDQEEKVLWTRDYEVEKSQILSLYNTVTKDISKEIGVRLTPVEEGRLDVSRTVDFDTYDAYLKGYQYIEDGGIESLNKAKEYLESAIEKDPDWAPLYSNLAFVWIMLSQDGFVSGETAYAKAKENLDKALELDPDLYNAHYVNAYIAYFLDWDWAKAEREFLKALAINPNDAMLRSTYAHLLGLLQRPKEALAQAQLAIDLDSLNDFIQIIYSSVLVLTGDCESAMATTEKILAVDSTNASANDVLSVAAYRCKDFEKLFEMRLQWSPLEDEIKTSIMKIYKEKGYTAAFKIIMNELDELNNQGPVWSYGMAIGYIYGNQQDKAMDCLEKAYEERDPTLPFIATKLMPFDSLYDNPRFIALLKKMNLPLP